MRRGKQRRKFLQRVADLLLAGRRAGNALDQSAKRREYIVGIRALLASEEVEADNAPSGSSASDNSFLKPGMLAAIAGETEMRGGGGRSGAEEASDRSLSLSLSLPLLLPFFFEGIIR